jgi:hypothetical protein
MNDYLDGSPFICVKSEVFFEFQARRMQELYNVQMRMSRHRGDNYGTSTALMMHLSRHVSHSPIAMAPYLRDTLRDKLFEENRERFGMFFVDGLVLEEGTIEGIPEKDSAECRKDMSRTALAKKKSRPSKGILSLNADPSSQFPLGNAPSWADITHALRHDPMKLLHAWTWDEEWSTDDIAADLFIHFTRQYWFTVHPSFLISEERRPAPNNLEESMQIWTVPSLLSILKQPTCIPSNHGLKGKFQGKGHRAFRDWVQVFFPLPNDPQHKDSVWRELYKYGYIQEYHAQLSKMSAVDGRVVSDSLGDVFERLQCIPSAAPSTPTNQGQLWKTADEQVIFWANPLLYRIEQVAPRTRAGGTVCRVKASRDTINALLAQELHGTDINNWRRDRRRLRIAHEKQKARKSTKKKNARVPPKKKALMNPSANVAPNSSSDGDSNDDLKQPRPSPVKRATGRVIITSEDSDNEAGNNDEGGYQLDEENDMLLDFDDQGYIDEDYDMEGDSMDID